MRTAVAAVLLILLVGCLQAAPSHTATTASPSTSRIGTTAPAITSQSVSHTTTTASGNGNLTVHLKADRDNTTAGLDDGLTLDAIFTDAKGRTQEPANVRWIVYWTKGSEAQQVAIGDEVPAVFAVRFPSLGDYHIVGQVGADGFDPVSTAIDIHVEASPILHERADRSAPRPELVAPTARTDIDMGSGGEGEPNIVIARDGTMYVTPITPLYRSTDQGASWQDLGSNDGTGDGDISVDDAGNVYWLGLGSGIQFQVSHDKGSTFSPGVDIGEGQGFDRQWIDAAPDGQLHAYWRDDRGLVYRHSPDGGAHWDAAQIVRGDAGANGPLVHDPTDPQRLYFAFPDNGVQIMASLDGGRSWHQHPIADVTGAIVAVAFETSIFPVVTVDDAGTVYALWSTANAPAPGVKEQSVQSVYLAYSLDAGTRWSKPLVISDPTKDSRLPWIVAGAPGRVAAAWYESVVANVPSESVPNEWNVVMWESVTADAPSPAAVKLQLNSGVAHIGAICTIGLFCVAGGDRSLADFFEMAIDANGQPVVTWMDSKLGTGVCCIAVEAGSTHFGGVLTGTPLR